MKSPVQQATVPPVQKTNPPQSTEKSWEEQVKEMNEKANQEYQNALKAQEEWSKQKAAKNQAWFKQQTEAAQKNQDTWAAEQRAKQQQEVEE